jgi:hypothetical protein
MAQSNKQKGPTVIEADDEAKNEDVRGADSSNYIEASCTRRTNDRTLDHNRRGSCSRCRRQGTSVCITAATVQHYQS